MYSRNNMQPTMGMQNRQRSYPPPCGGPGCPPDGRRPGGPPPCGRPGGPGTPPPCGGPGCPPDGRRPGGPPPCERPGMPPCGHPPVHGMESAVEKSSVRQSCASDQGAKCMMDCRKPARKESVGMAYVPWQKFGNLYCPDQGLLEGTIFKDLNLIFCGVRGGRR